MAILKHIAVKSANYGAALTYLKYQHDELLLKPVLDSSGHMILREEFYLDGINCCPETFDLECEMLNEQYRKNRSFSEIKSHHYIISFDPADKDECGLTGERAQAIGMEYAKKNFPGHQALVCTHMDGHNGSGNIHVHIIINSLRKTDIEPQPFTERPIDCKAGYKHHLTDDYLKHLQRSLMKICLREGLNQVDLLNPSPCRISAQEYRAKQKGQVNLDKLNSAITADGLTPMKAKFQTEKEKIREAIIGAAKKASSFDEFQKLLHDEYDIFVKETRGRYSYLPKGREKPISARSLGANFDKAHLLSIFQENAAAAKEKQQRSLNDPLAVLYIKSNLRLVVNLQDCVKAQQSRAYAQKVKISNLQRMAKTIAYVQEHEYDTQADLQKAYDDISEKTAKARPAVKATDDELAALNERIHYTGQYLSSKAVYSQFLKASNKKAFREEHSEDIVRHEAALRFLKQHSPDGRFSTIKELRAEKDSLLAKRAAQYDAYTYFKEYQKELQTVCSNVDMILNPPITHEATRENSQELS